MADGAPFPLDPQSGADKDAFKKEMKRRVSLARTDRLRRASLINEVFRLASPWRRQVGAAQQMLSQAGGDPQLSPDDVADILDSTLQDTVEDFAADMMARFTPVQEVWAKFEPAEMLPPEILRQIEEPVARTQDYVYSEIERSNFTEAALEFYQELASGTAGMSILSEGPNNPLICEPITIADLLLDRGPHGFVDGRWRERTLEKRMFEACYGAYGIKLPPTLSGLQPESSLQILDGVVRSWANKAYETYTRMLFVNDQLVWSQNYDGAGAAHIIACRWATSGTCVYGIGPAFKASPDQRVLNELKAMVLAAGSKLIDPPAFYDDDGVINFDQGLDAGDMIPRAPGSKVDTLKMEGKLDLAFFEFQELQANIRRALYQDKPYQRGDTPPTLGQWTDEKARTERRLEIPRGKVINEFVLPVLKRVVWLRSKEGQIDPVRLGDRVIKVVPQSTFGRARAYERVASSERLLNIMRANMPDQMAVIDAAGTIRNIKADMDEQNVVVLSPDQIKQAAALAAQAQGVDPSAMGAGAPQQPGMQQ